MTGEYSPIGSRGNAPCPPPGGGGSGTLLLLTLMVRDARAREGDQPMPHKLIRMQRQSHDHAKRNSHSAVRPIMVAIAGDSAAGKTTITKGLVTALGEDRGPAFSPDDYHRYDRAERRGLPFTALHPDCNYGSIMEQHLQPPATGQPVLKPVY